MPPKSLKTRTPGSGGGGGGEGGGGGGGYGRSTGRKPMKTALVQDSGIISDPADTGSVAAAVAAAEDGAAGATAGAGAEAVGPRTMITGGSVSSIEVNNITQDCSQDELKYLNGLSFLEQRVCFIAKDHLKSSFDLERSSGFIAWKKNN